REPAAAEPLETAEPRAPGGAARVASASVERGGPGLVLRHAGAPLEARGEADAALGVAGLAGLVAAIHLAGDAGIARGSRVAEPGHDQRGARRERGPRAERAGDDDRARAEVRGRARGRPWRRGCAREERGRVGLGR